MMGRYAKLYYWRGECHTLRRWSQILNIPLFTLYTRSNCCKVGDELFAPVTNYTTPQYIKFSPTVVRERLKRVICGRKEMGLDTLHLEIELDYVVRGMRRVA